MAHISYIHPIGTILGRLCKSIPTAPVCRRKVYRDKKGSIVGYGRNETYVVKRPRDYVQQPPTQGEQRSISAFRMAAQQYQLEKQNLKQMAYWRARWQNQLKKGESDAPRDPHTGRHHIYRRLDIFIRTCLFRDLLIPH